jgi:hypothetical protein
MSTTTASSGPYAGETKIDAWLFEHSKFLRKHFSPQGPTEIPSKHELVQERLSGDAYPRETKMDVALFEHSKFLRNHVKHDGDDAAIKSKHAMLRESFDHDGERPRARGETGGASSGPIILRKSMRRSISTTNEALHDEPVAAATAATVTAPEITNGADPMDGEPAHFLVTEDTPYRHHPHIETHNHAPTTVPAWQAATDTSQGYGDDGAPPAAAGGAGGVVGASAHTGPGLISHHPTTMESIPVVSRPVPHSLMSNSIYATEGVVGDAEEVEGEVVDENPMVR